LIAQVLKRQIRGAARILMVRLIVDRLALAGIVGGWNGIAGISAAACGCTFAVGVLFARLTLTAISFRLAVVFVGVAVGLLVAWFVAGLGIRVAIRWLRFAIACVLRAGFVARLLLPVLTFAAFGGIAAFG
jgi:hypothetical protein